MRGYGCRRAAEPEACRRRERALRERRLDGGHPDMDKAVAEKRGAQVGLSWASSAGAERGVVRRQAGAPARQLADRGADEFVTDAASHGRLASRSARGERQRRVEWRSACGGSVSRRRSTEPNSIASTRGARDVVLAKLVDDAKITGTRSASLFAVVRRRRRQEMGDGEASDLRMHRPASRPRVAFEFAGVRL